MRILYFKCGVVLVSKMILHHTREYSDVRENIQTYERIFRHTREYSDIRENIQTYERIFRHTREYSDIRDNIQTYERIFRRRAYIVESDYAPMAGLHTASGSCERRFYV